MSHESKEVVTVRGFDTFHLATPTDIHYQLLQNKGEATFGSEVRGGKVDNPVHPASLTELQQARSVVLSYPETSRFTMNLAEVNFREDQGRNVLFAGPSSLVCSPGKKSCGGYMCPAGFERRQSEEFLLCAGSECKDSDRDTCCY